jgi:hypothetical protein
MIRRFVYAGIPLSLGFLVVLAWPLDTPTSPEISTAGPDEEQQRHPTTSSKDRLHATNTVALALSAVERARREPQVAIERPLSEFDRIALKDRRATNLKGGIMDAMDEREALVEETCPGFANLEGTTLEVVFQVTSTQGRAAVRNPSLRVLSGAPLDPTLERCYLGVLSSFNLTARPSGDFIEYEGPVDIQSVFGAKP